MEPETIDMVYFIIDNNLQYSWKLFSTKANRSIGNWINRNFYKEENYGTTFVPYKFTHGELYLRGEIYSRHLRLIPYAEFILINEKGQPLEMSYSTLHSYYSDQPSFLTEKQYIAEQEKSRRYIINYEFPSDTLLSEKIKDLPFKSILGYTNQYSNYISQIIEPGYSPSGDKKLKNGVYILVGDKISVRGVDYYKACYEGKTFYIKSEDVTLIAPEKLDTLMNCSQDIRDAFFDYAKVLSYINYLEKKRSNIDKFLEYSKRGLIVKYARPYDMSEYTDGTGMEFSVINTSDKVIKYITFNFTGYNAVDDAVLHVA